MHHVRRRRGLVAGSTSFGFVVLHFLFQLTFSHRLLVSSYLTFAYKYLAPGLVKGHRNQIRRRFPLLSLYSRVNPTPAGRLTNTRNQRAVPRLTARATRMFRLSFICLSFYLDCAARPYRLKSSG